ncbi:hypothetical protein CISG_09351 [Coccidioides immitis RMSCC 3703]|uniref:Uncharacterized protein n=1 Tax=Coccidioides immitis RMSCC 3703 TaxID=454286 RepID=A0A0J8RDA5_COCIT|nr:hypothetical protein CISG_09351 [Coccidioides immitis RMSCC 3703]
MISQIIVQSPVKSSNETSDKPDSEQSLQHADPPENKTLTEITEDDLKISDSPHESLQDSASPVRVLTPSTPPTVELEHMDLDDSLLIDLDSLLSSDKTDDNDKKNNLN